MAATTRTGPERRRRRVALIAVIVAGALAACQPIVADSDGLISSHATMAASPTTTTVGARAVAAIEIRMRDCHTARLRHEDGSDSPVHLSPYARVVDARGVVVFDNMPWLQDAAVIPPGARVTDGGDGGDPHRIVVPVAGHRPPLTIEAMCLLWTVGSHHFYPRWTFPRCRTATRTCAATDPGEGTWAT